MGCIEMVIVVKKIREKLLEEANLFDEVKDLLRSVVCMLKRLRPFVMEIQRKRIPKMKEFIKLLNQIDDASDLYVTTAATGVGGMTADGLRSHFESFKLRLQKWHKGCLTCIPLPPPLSSSSLIALKDDREVVAGLENEVRTMIERLMDMDPRRDVIPLVGPGGVGKTTLARRVYNHPTTVENFPCRAWIYGCSDHGFSITKLLQEIFNQVCLHPPATATATATATADHHHHHREEKMILRDLANQIYKQLKSSDRYLVVFDDVWRTQFWDVINVIFPDINRNGGGGGGRIIFTTRYNEVASYVMPRNPAFYLQLTLNREESWTLFCTRALSSYSSREETTVTRTNSREGEQRKSLLSLFTTQMEPDHNPWKQCVDQCGGLPAAIVELAAQHQGLNWSVSIATADNKEDDKHWDERFPERIWELIYDNLPDHLKPLLLYLGVLDSCYFSIFKELLIAEGLVVEQPKTQLGGVVDCTGVAENYVNELIDRNLIEVVSKHWDGEIKEITISKRFQLINFCRAKATEEIFFEMVEFVTNRIATRGLYETLFDQGRYKTYHDFIREAPPMKARSFLRLDFPGGIHEGIYWTRLLGHTLLRVLDFSVAFSHTIPPEIDTLVLLRYLRINCTEHLELPGSICNLWNLQFLRLKNNLLESEITHLENKFWKMKQLNHLLCTDVLFLPQPPPEEGHRSRSVVLYNLQRLKHLSVDCCTKDRLSSMPNLVRLGVGGDIQQKHIYEISTCLSQLKHLQKLVLRGRGTKSLPMWDLFPLNVTHLTFKSTRLPGYSMGILGKLPNLQFLKLAFYAVDGDNLDTIVSVTTDDQVDGWFHQLRCLKLQDLSIRRWNLSVGAMPNLQVLVIRNCTLLQALPSEALQKIHTLREIEIHGYVDPAVETAALEIQEFMGKNQLQLRLKKRN